MRRLCEIGLTAERGIDRGANQQRSCEARQHCAAKPSDRDPPSIDRGMLFAIQLDGWLHSHVNEERSTVCAAVEEGRPHRCRRVRDAHHCRILK